MSEKMSTPDATQTIDSYMLVTGGRPPIMQRNAMPVMCNARPIKRS